MTSPQIAAALIGRTQSRALVLIETVYSVLGDAAPVAAIADLCERYDAVLIADEAHAIGVAALAVAACCMPRD